MSDYSKDVCHFCGKSDHTHPTQDSRNVAGFSRVHEGKTFDACEACARKAEFKQEDTSNGF